MKIAPLMMGVILVLGAGCASYYSAPFKPPSGILFTSFKAPLTMDFHDTPVRNEFGEAHTIYLRDCVFTGIDVAFQQCDVESAVRNGGLASVDYADYEYFQILGIFSTMKVRAYGPAVSVEQKSASAQ